MFKSKDGRIRSGWKILMVTLSFLGIATALTMVIGIVIGVLFITSGNLSITTEDIMNSDNLVVQTLYFVSQALSSIIMLLVPIIAWKFIMKRKLKDIGLTSFRFGKKDLFVGLLFGAVSMAIVFLLFIVTGFAHVESWIPTLSKDTFIYIITFVLVGFAEEIYGRGFIMGALKQTKNYPIIFIVSSVIFALLHGLNGGFTILPFINLTLVGLLFAYMYVKSDNIWMCIGYHITWNYFQGNVFGLNVSGMEVNGLLTTVIDKQNKFTGEEFGPEGGLFVTIILLLGFIFVHYFYRSKKVDFLASERDYEAQLLQDFQSQYYHQPIYNQQYDGNFPYVGQDQVDTRLNDPQDSDNIN